jgi:hypothetical protein
MPVTCPNCQRAFGNAGNLANHRRRCFYNVNFATASQGNEFPQSKIAEPTDDMDLQPWQQVARCIKRAREVRVQ